MDGWFGALAPTDSCSTMCGVVGSSPVAARSRGAPHHRGIGDRAVILDSRICIHVYEIINGGYGRKLTVPSVRPKIPIIIIIIDRDLEKSFWS